VITPRSLLAAALAAATLAIPSHASARPAPLDGPADTSVSVHNPAAGGRTDQQFWGQATWLNPLSGLNLDRSSAAR
jgi:hypothetical protein